MKIRKHGLGGVILVGLFPWTVACHQAVPLAVPPPLPAASVQMRTQWVHLPVRMEFPTSQDELTQEQRALLREVVQTMRSRPDVRRLRIEGHADSRGTPQENLQLSFRRAQTVLEALLQLGIEQSSLEAVGFGDTHPITDESSASDLTRNRRVEFRVLVESPVP